MTTKVFTVRPPATSEDRLTRSGREPASSELLTGPTRKARYHFRAPKYQFILNFLLKKPFEKRIDFI